MKHQTTIRLTCMLVAIMASLAGTPGAGATQMQTVPCGAWTIVTSPNPFQSINMLNAVTAVSASDVWAVGWGAASENSNYLTLIEHWNGTSWQVVKSPSPSALGNILTAVTAISASDVWAVGYDDQDSQTLTEHWDGQHWSVVSSPNVGVLRNVLYSVTASSPTNVWAVGLSRIDGSTPNQALVEHWDGTRWSVITSPHLAHSDFYLNGVTASSPDDIWAVGQSSHLKRSSVPHTLIEHWDGSQWRVVSSPNRGEAGSSLNSLAAVSAQNMWTVGQGGVNATLTEHGDGTKWSIVNSPNGPSQDNNILYGVTAIAATDIWTVGRYYDFFKSRFRTLTEHWDGTDWTLIASPNVAPYDTYLNGVTATSTKTVWAVGAYYNGNSIIQTLIEHWDGSKWRVVHSPDMGTRLKSIN